jgi:hypothetical protein
VVHTVVGIDGDDGVLAKTGSILLVDDRTAREDMTYRVAGNGWFKMLPMNQVLAHSMSPVHIAPLASVWVILEIEMILSILIYHTVRVVHATSFAVHERFFFLHLLGGNKTILPPSAISTH